MGKFLVLSVFSAVALTYCGSKDDSSSSTSPTSPAVATTADVTFTQVNTVLQDRCKICHDTFVAYEGVVEYVSAGEADASKLYTMVLSDQMPQSGAPLSAAQKEMIKNWINEGAKDD